MLAFASAQLGRLGWNSEFEGSFRNLAPAGAFPARVSSQAGGWLDAIGADGSVRVAAIPEAVVGDWIGVIRTGQEARAAGLLPRATEVRRKQPGDDSRPQVLAANVDLVFVVASLHEQPNLRRIERYLVVARDGGAEPVVVLNKADLSADAETHRRRAESELGVRAVLTDALRSDGVDVLVQSIAGCRTAVLLGPSGAGKSSLANAIGGSAGLRTGATHGPTGEGRHTTTHRQLLPLPQGGALIDTPGLRELQLPDSGDALEQVFADVVALAAGCRFRDCGHASEPGCAVRADVEAGRLDPLRVASYLKLAAEVERSGTRLRERARNNAARRRRHRAAEIADAETRLRRGR